MPTGRYNNRLLFRNDNVTYETILEDRHVKFIRQYGTARIAAPTIAQRASLNSVSHIWKVGDRFWKLAIRFYNDPQYWWLIALYNQAPTESDLSVGNPIQIPLPLERALRIMRA